MANYAILKSAIEAVVKTNGNQEITGANLQATLLSIINSLGADYQFAGVGTPSTSAGTPDENVFYLCGQGNYSNFGNSFRIHSGEIGIVSWNGSWSVSVVDSSIKYDEPIKGNASRFVDMFPYELQTMEPSSIISSSFFYLDGDIRQNSSFSIYKFEVEPHGVYSFTGTHSSTVDIPFVGWFDSGGSLVRLENTPLASVSYSDEVVIVPEGASYAWLNVANGTYPSTTNFKKLDSVHEVMSMRGYLPSCNLGDVRTPGTWMLVDSNTYEDKPMATVAGWLRVSLITDLSGYNWVLQEFYSFESELYKREFRFNATSVEAWSLVGSGENTMRMCGYLPSCSLADVRTTGTWMLVDSNTYEDMPMATNAGWLRVSLITDLSGYNWVLQEFYSFGAELYKREFRFNATSVEAWSLVGGGGGSVTNEYTFNEYQQTVNLTATPTITTDTNNYLASTGDTTNRTADILAMLQATGTCHLGTGDFWVDSLVMPANTSLIGCGNATRVKLIAGDNKFAIKMSSYCTVSDMWIWGSSSFINHTSTVGTRHGILWQGNYTEVSDSSVQPKATTIDNVYLYGFTGGGITCYDTGYGTTNYIAATNVHIEDCGAGLNISYWSEFHKFTNVRCWSCYYGCINNGGNNIFVNCDFSANSGIAFLMDNSQSQSPNNSHGSCIGCVFNHTASNTGVGIKILNCNNGYVFSGCQIFFSKIQIEDTAGIVVSSCNFGKNNCNISITNGGVILFVNNMHEDTPPSITIVNNNNVHFVNCYSRATNSPITN